MKKIHIKIIIDKPFLSCLLELGDQKNYRSPKHPEEIVFIHMKIIHIKTIIDIP